MGGRVRTIICTFLILNAIGLGVFVRVVDSQWRPPGPNPRVLNNYAFELIQNAKKVGHVDFREVYYLLWCAANWQYAFAPSATRYMAVLHDSYNGLLVSDLTERPVMTRKEYYTWNQRNIENAVYYSRKTLEGINRQFEQQRTK